jgi:uncharacterized membrane protein
VVATGATWLRRRTTSSLVGVIFETYFTYLEPLFVIDAICIWCATLVTLLLRFVLSAWVGSITKGTAVGGQAGGLGRRLSRRGLTERARALV